MNLRFSICLAGLLLCCNTTPKEFQSVSGRIAITARGNAWWYEPSSGLLLPFDTLHPGITPRVLMKYGDSLLIGLHLGIEKDIPGTDSLWPYPYYYYYWHVPFTRRYSEMVQFKPPAYMCDMIDCDSSSSQFLYAGRFQDTNGIFVLNKNFRLGYDLSSRVSILGERTQNCRARFVKGGILYEVGREVRLLPDGSTEAIMINANASILDVSKSRTHAALLEHDGRKGRIVDYCASSGETTTLPIFGEIAGAVYAPNDSLLAYSLCTNNFDNDVDLYLYDFEHRNSKFTGVRLAIELSVWIK